MRDCHWKNKIKSDIAQIAQIIIKTSEKSVENTEEIKEMDLDTGNPRYLKAQIALLKRENLRLSKLTEENASKQQLMEAWDNLYSKDIELQTLEQKLSESNAKFENKRNK